MICLQAANAAARWADETAIATEASPISTRPVRCQIAARRQPWRRSAARAMRSISCSAIPGKAS